MPTVVIASPKGGAGKSTTAVILGTEFAHAGANVTMMDCDPNGSLTLWSERGTLPERIEVVSGLKESEIIKAIKAHDQDGRILFTTNGMASNCDCPFIEIEADHINLLEWQVFEGELVPLIPDPEAIRASVSLDDRFTAATVLALGDFGDVSALPEALQEREVAPRERRPLAETVIASA